MLVALDRPGGRNFFRRTGAVADRELSWLDFSIATGLSRDGRWILINEQGGGIETAESVDLFLRETSGKPPMKLGPGWAWGFSANDRIVAAQGFSPPGIVLYPIPSGSSETILVKGITITAVAGLLPPDDQLVVITGSELGRSDRIWLVGRDGTQAPADFARRSRSGKPTGDPARWDLHPRRVWVVGLGGRCWRTRSRAESRGN